MIAGLLGSGAAFAGASDPEPNDSLVAPEVQDIDDPFRRGIDRIADQGVRFDHCYVSDAPCLPSRAAMFTGQFGIHSGVVNHGGVAADRYQIGRERGFNTHHTFPGFIVPLRWRRSVGRSEASLPSKSTAVSACRASGCRNLSRCWGFRRVCDRVPGIGCWPRCSDAVSPETMLSMVSPGYIRARAANRLASFPSNLVSMPSMLPIFSGFTRAKK